MRHAAALGLAILAAACTAQGKKYLPAETAAAAGEGVIYVYRPMGAWVTRGENPYVQIGRDDLGPLRAGGFVSKAVPAGEHEIVVRQSLLLMPIWSRSIDVAVAEGGSAYVRVDQRYTQFGQEGGASARQEVFIEEVDSLAGQADLEKTRAN